MSQKQKKELKNATIDAFFKDWTDTNYTILGLLKNFLLK